MKLYKAYGSCSVCGKFTKLDGISDAEEVIDLAKEDHYDDHGHFFKGEMKVEEYSNEPPKKRRITGIRRP